MMMMMMIRGVIAVCDNDMYVCVAVFSSAGACRGMSMAAAVQLRVSRLQSQHALPLYESCRRADTARCRGRLRPGTTFSYHRIRARVRVSTS